MKTPALAVTAAAVLIGAAVLASVGGPDPARAETAAGERTVAVRGSGSVRVVPDRAQFSFGVTTRGETAREALAANARAMTALIAALRQAGVGEDGLQTESVSVWPRSERDRITGYTASNSVLTTIEQIGRAGAVVDAAVAAGANQLWGPQLSKSDSDAVLREALAKAVTDARRKGEALATAAGLSLGAVVKVEEAGDGVPVYERQAVGASKADAATPIEPGRLETSAEVSVTFELR